jgi:PAS domain S-box-containing protein
MSKPLHILILEGQPADADLIERELRKAGFEFVARIVTTEKEFLAGLRDAAPDLILADYSLPAYDGLAALAAAQEQCPETPFIVVSGSLGQEQAIEALQRGAAGWVLTERLERLGPAARRALSEQEERRKGRQAEEQRHPPEARYYALFEQSPDGMLILDPETARPLEFNTAAHRQLGYSREEFGRLSLADIEADETPEQTRVVMDRVRREGKADFETRQRTREGQIRHVHVTAQVVKASGRSVYHCVWRDITERKRVEDLLRESEQRYRRLFNSGYDAVFVHQEALAGNGQGKFIEVNDIACQRLGYTREELLQRTPRDISAPETLAVVPEIRARLAAEKFAVSEGVHITKDGRRIPVEISTHVFDLNGKSTRLSTVRDITERKRAEEALGQRAEELRARNAELTRFNRLAVSRELRMIELKQEVNELCRGLGEPPRYGTQTNRGGVPTPPKTPPA